MTRLEAIILGLLADRPMTGYEILKMIAESPSRSVRSSAGSVYPALKRLAKAGKNRAEDASTGERPASIYHLTSEGAVAFGNWLRESVSFATPTATEDLLLRVIFSHHMTVSDLRKLLLSYRDAMMAQVSDLEATKPAWPTIPVRQRLCLQNGLISAKAQLDWVILALEELNIHD